MTAVSRRASLLRFDALGANGLCARDDHGRDCGGYHDGSLLSLGFGGRHGAGGEGCVDDFGGVVDLCGLVIRCGGFGGPGAGGRHDGCGGLDRGGAGACA